ncbi:hypothetical protein RHGRI_011612 [Rhododendron griersonianum]|uniref:Uncharacterized protein n=1 Tax=Rhododendron griersonianum TaxID=479676 RepID=A0AAV6KNF0_9ERIC|nr:hypothetical protein RHGRI_011612 [Rhododendron griersonianum]
MGGGISLGLGVFQFGDVHKVDLGRANGLGNLSNSVSLGEVIAFPQGEYRYMQAPICYFGNSRLFLRVDACLKLKVEKVLIGIKAGLLKNGDLHKAPQTWK